MPWTEWQQHVMQAPVSKKKKSYRGIRGRIPDKPGWRRIGDIGAHRGVEWDVYRGPVTPDSQGKPCDWVIFKLVATAAVLRKGNFWLAWNGERWGAFKDPVYLETYWPALFKAFGHYLAANGWITFRLESFARTPPEHVAQCKAILAAQRVKDEAEAAQEYDDLA